MSIKKLTLEQVATILHTEVEKIITIPLEQLDKLVELSNKRFFANQDYENYAQKLGLVEGK